nr:NifU family protein [Alloyangia pacifica]
MAAEGLIKPEEAYVFGAAPKPQKKKAQGFVIPDMPPAPKPPAQPSAPVQIEPIQIAVPAAAAPAPVAVVEAPTPAPAPVSGLSPAKEAIVVSKIIEEMRPTFRRDGGDVELVDMEGSLVLVSLVGACSGCQLAASTLGGIAKVITETLGRPIRVMPVAKS